MFLTNHTLTGLLIGSQITEPLVLAPVALASHFVLDALPHYGNRDWSVKEPTRAFWAVIAADMSGSLGLVALAVWTFGDLTGPLLIGAFFATLPDLLYIPRFLFNGWVPNRAYARFHKWIQWGERPWGWTIELIFFLVFIRQLA